VGVLASAGARPGLAHCLDSVPAAWRRAALLALAFAEDFAIVDGASGRVPWLAVCLPSHWSPASKVGLRFTEIHAPVADSRMLRSRGEQLMQLVSAGEPWERFVWTLTPNPRLDAHPERVAHVAWPLDSDAEALARQTFLRTERQTFIPVPGHRQAIFTIHVEVSALADAVTTAEAAQHLHDGLASMSEAVLAYRRLAEPRDRLLAWLAAKAAA
jgi:hypothetical protein